MSREQFISDEFGEQLIDLYVQQAKAENATGIIRAETSSQGAGDVIEGYKRLNRLDRDAARQITEAERAALASLAFEASFNREERQEKIEESLHRERQARWAISELLETYDSPLLKVTQLDRDGAPNFTIKNRRGGIGNNPQARRSVKGHAFYDENPWGNHMKLSVSVADSIFWPRGRYYVPVIGREQTPLVAIRKVK